MLSTCPDCSKATWVWAQPAVDGLWGAQPCCGSELSPTAAAPCGYVRWKARTDTPHTAEMCSHHPKGNDSESRKELSCSQPSCRGRRQQACRAQNGASHSTSGSAPHGVRASPPTNPRMGIRRAPSRGQWTGTRAPPKRAIAESLGFQQGPQSQWDISSWDNPQHLPVPPDTALEHQKPSGLPPVRQQPQDTAASESCSHTAPRWDEAQQHGRSTVPMAPSSQPALVGRQAVRAMVHHHQYAYHLPSMPPLQPICDHTWLRRRGSCRGGGGGGGDPLPPSQRRHTAQPGAGAIPLQEQGWLMHTALPRPHSSHLTCTHQSLLPALFPTFFVYVCPNFPLLILSSQHPVLLELLRALQPSSTSRGPAAAQPKLPYSHPIPYIPSQAGAAEQHGLQPPLLRGSTWCPRWKRSWLEGPPNPGTLRALPAASEHPEGSQPTAAPAAEPQNS